jgi:predicted ATPase
MQLAAKLRQTADRHVLRPYQAVAKGFEAEALLQKGDVVEAIQAFKNAVQQLKDARYGLYESVFSRSLTLALLEAGEIIAAEQIVLDHLARIEGTGGSYDQAEWLRIKAQVEELAGQRNAAERTLRRSIVMATEQGATAWVLRSATSLARLLMAQDGPEQAAAELIGAFSSYSEGFATQDLGLAKELLLELGFGDEI